MEGDCTLSDRTTLLVDGVLEILSVCVNSVYFQFNDSYYTQREGLPMGSCPQYWPIDIYMEWFENRIFGKNINKPKLWLRYVDDTFVILPHGRDHLDQFL